MFAIRRLRRIVSQAARGEHRRWHPYCRLVDENFASSIKNCVRGYSHCQRICKLNNRANRAIKHEGTLASGAPRMRRSIRPKLMLPRRAQGVLEPIGFASRRHRLNKACSTLWSKEDYAYERQHSASRNPNRNSAVAFQELAPELIAFAQMVGDLLTRHWAKRFLEPTDSTGSVLPPPRSTGSGPCGSTENFSPL